MKHSIKSTTMYLCLAVALSGLMLSACGSSGGGGGTVDVDNETTWYLDSDGDGFGTSETRQSVEDQPEGYVANANDCNDSNPNISPMAEEINDDGVDNNCNGMENDAFQPIYPDTGQTKSYTDTFGEDSDFTIDEPSYTKLDQNQNVLEDSAQIWAMVQDNVTGLTWEVKNSSDGYENPSGNLQDIDNDYSWEEAQDFIIDMNEAAYGGYEDWRLPTVHELCSLANSKVYTNVFPVDFFPHAGSLTIWSAIAVGASSDEAWYVKTDKGIPGIDKKSQKYSVWAVRGKKRAPDLEAYGRGIVLDKTTGLMWQMTTAKYDEDDVDNRHFMTFDEALEYCEDLELGGFKDWRLPSKNELASLIRFGVDEDDLAIADNFFVDILNTSYWTSTTFLTINDDDSSKGWTINFSSVTLSSRVKTKSGVVLAVRGGKNTATRTWYEDADHDVYGNPDVILILESTQPQPLGYAPRAMDCDDTDASINPAAIDIDGDGIDSDCSSPWYLDDDGDTFGELLDVIYAEIQPTGYVDNSDDCDDTDPDVNPDADELTGDDIDNDCDGETL